MPTIKYNNSSVIIEKPQSVLDGLNKAGASIPFSCRAGLCQACLMQSDTPPPLKSQQGLTANQKTQNLFLACCCFPNVDMSVNLLGNKEKSKATVIDKKMLNQTVLALYIQIDYSWLPGQYLTLWLNEVAGRSYSIANRCDHEKIIELHIKKHDQGLVSRWLHDDLNVGDTINVSKPMGNCFYTFEHSDKPILMAATGTGLAPLMGILKDALAKNHNKPIYLYSGAGDSDGLYYRKELSELAAEHQQVFYIPVVRRDAGEDNDIVKGDIVEVVKQRHKDLKGWKVFLCGNESMIKQVQRHCFFQGATVNDILVDAFIIDKPE